ncbi:reverse transcriptase domain-containing protein [Tanacetum coccineum]|uniref:Reverse transcriptase domain-containing protein n=1 Tax=Tanacetum coccineum TaxID=301880 RepID=A0ABQ5H5Y3_9ASTR
MGVNIARTRFESVSKHSNDSLLARGNTLRSDEDRLKLDELMTLWVESSGDEESLGEDASKQGRIDAIDADEEITLVSVHDVNVSAGEEVFVAEQEVADITLAQALVEMKSTKLKKKGVVRQELDGGRGGQRKREQDRADTEITMKQNVEDGKEIAVLKQSTRPVEDLDLILWGDLKTMFEPHVEDKVWRNQQEYKVLDWKLYDSCGLRPTTSEVVSDARHSCSHMATSPSDDEDEEPTPQLKTQNPKPVKETPLSKPYKLKISVRLADRSFQYPVGIAENMFIEVGKFTFPVDFVILEMEEDSKVPLILGRPFLYTADAVIQVKQRQLNLGVGTERIIFNIDSAMKHSYSNDDTCFSIDVIDEILEEDFDVLLDEGSKILHFIEGSLLEEEIFAEFDEFMAMTADENSDSESDTEDASFEKITINTNYKIKA